MLTTVMCAGTADEQRMYDHIKQDSAMLLSKRLDCIFSVLNKVDIRKFCSGATVEEYRKHVADGVTKAMSMLDFTLKPEQASA